MSSMRTLASPSSESRAERTWCAPILPCFQSFLGALLAILLRRAPTLSHEAKEIIGLPEAPGRLSLKEPTVSFGLLHFWTFNNGPNSTEHHRGPDALQRAGSTALPESFLGPWLVGLSFFVVVFKCNNFCMCDFIRKLDHFLPTQPTKPVARERTGIVSIKLYLIVKKRPGHT